MNQPELLKHALERQIRRLGIVRQLAGGRVLALWSEVVGPQIAARARPESFENGTLIVVVPEAAWRHELTLQKKEFITNLNTAAQRPVVRDIYFVAVSRKRD